MSPDSRLARATTAETTTAETAIAQAPMADPVSGGPLATRAGISLPGAAQPQSRAATVDDIVGYIDGIGAHRVAGWAMNRSRPDERLVVRLSLDGEPIGEATADRSRQDLARSGIGDGTYGFEIAPTRAVPHGDRIRIAAVAFRAGADDGAAVPLENLIARKLASESPGEEVAAVTTQLQQVLDEGRALQRRTDHALRLIAAELRDLRERAESQPAAARAPENDRNENDRNEDDRNEDDRDQNGGNEKSGIAKACAAIRETQADLARQLSEVGVIQARIDQALSALHEDGPPAPDGSDDRSLRRLVMVLAGMSGTALVLGILSLIA